MLASKKKLEAKSKFKLALLSKKLALLSLSLTHFFFRINPLIGKKKTQLKLATKIALVLV